MNQYCAMGYLAFDPSLRTSSNGIDWLQNQLRVRRKKRNADGKYGYDSIPFVSFGTSADMINKYVKKGDPVILTGHLESTFQRLKVMKDDGTTYEKPVTVVTLNVDSVDLIPKTEMHASTSAAAQEPEENEPAKKEDSNTHESKEDNSYLYYDGDELPRY